MSLLTRLIAPVGDEKKLSLLTFRAALAELKRGAPGYTITSVGDHFELTAQERVELQKFVDDYYLDRISRDLLDDVLLLGEHGAYTVPQAEERLVNVTDANQNLLPLIVQRQIEILARSVNNYVLRGCAVSAQASPDMTLAVAKGAVFTNDILRAVAAADVTIAAADAALPRFDLVVIDSSGAKVVRQGTPAPSPQPPPLSVDDVALCFVYVSPGITAIGPLRLSDARIVVTSGPALVGKVTTPVVFSNTNAAQTYINLPLPAGLMIAGKILRIRCGGHALLNSGTPNITLRISYGGTTMFQDVTVNAASDVDRLAWYLEFELVAVSLTAQTLSGVWSSSPMGAKTAPNTGRGDLAGVGVSAPFSGSAAVDSDAANRLLQVVLIMSVANPNNEISMDFATGELV